MVTAQAGLIDVVMGNRAAFGIYASQPQTAGDILADLRLVGRAAGAALRAGAGDIDTIGEELASRYVQAHDPAGESKDPTIRRIQFAVETTLGYRALQDPEQVMRLARDFVPAATPCADHTLPLQRILLSADGTRRHRTAYLQRRQAGSTVSLEKRARKLPARLWSEWASRLNPRPGSTAEYIAESLSVAVLMAGSGVLTSDAASLFGIDAPGGGQVSYVLQCLGRGDISRDIVLDAISECAAYLDENDIPIDYARRRSLEYADLLPAPEWNRICARLDLQPGGEKTRAQAGTYLYQLLTGNPIRTARAFRHDRHDITPAVAGHFAATLPPALRVALEHVGIAFLNSHGIDEPLTWAPPLAPVQCLGTRSTKEPGLARARSWTPARPVRGSLDHASIRHQYLEGATTYDLAAQLSVSRQTVSRTVHDSGATTRTGRRSTYTVNTDWLRHRYIDERRTIPQIAEEVGCTPMTINRLLHRAKIPVRPRGSGSEAQALHAASCAGGSELLRRTLVGRSAAQTAQRFLTVTRHTTIGAAAISIGVSASVLSTQMSKLSLRAGGQLINHAERNRPLSLTALGEQLATELERVSLTTPQSEQELLAESAV